MKRVCYLYHMNETQTPNQHTIMSTFNNTPENGYHITWAHANFLSNVTRRVDAREPLFAETWDVPTREDVMRMAYYDPSEFEAIMQLVINHAKPHIARAIKFQMKLGKERGQATK